MEVNGDASGGMLMSDAIPESEPVELKKGDDSDDSLDKEPLPYGSEPRGREPIEEEGDVHESDGSQSGLSSKPKSYTKRSKDQIEETSKKIKYYGYEQSRKSSRRSQTVFNYQDFPVSNSPMVIDRGNVMSSSGA